MTQPRVSVVVVSRGRPGLLRRCLTGVFQIYYPQFEVVVVADAPGKAAIAAWGSKIKLVGFEGTNISAARNAGVSVADGEIIAFIDDDAVPEPMWLTQLVAPFADERVSAAGGYVIGRNGFSFQWMGQMVFADGETQAIPVCDDKTTVVQSGPGRGVKTEGTNMAIRRDVLARMGGFDTAFHFFMDETDLNMRLAEESAQTAIVPLARVHHGYAPSARRTQKRVPRDLFDIGASTAVFQRKHRSAPASPLVPRDQQRRRLLRHMVSGDIMPGDVWRLLRRFDEGWKSGMAREIGKAGVIDASPPAFKPITPMNETDIVRVARFWQRKKAEQAVAQSVKQGHRVTLFLLSFTALWHRARFDPDGYWVHSGGQFGKSRRTDPWFRFLRATDRVQQESDRLRGIRFQNAPKIQNGV